MLVEGIDSVSSKTVQCRHSYTAADIVADHLARGSPQAAEDLAKVEEDVAPDGVGARGMPVTWPRAGLQSAKSDAQMKARSCIETVCTESHYCGMNGQGKCVCVQGGSEEGGQ